MAAIILNNSDKWCFYESESYFLPSIDAGIAGVGSVYCAGH